MNQDFTQPTLVTNDHTHRQLLARKYGCKVDDVLEFSVGADLTGKKAIFSHVTEEAYALPAGITGTIRSMANGILTNSDGVAYDLAELAAKHGDYVHTNLAFGMAGTLTTHNQTMLFGAQRYRWAGALPKTITAGQNPTNTGGISDTAWVLCTAAGIVTPRGGNLADWMVNTHISEFTNRVGAPGGYANMLDAIQAAMDYARTTPSKVLDCRGWVGTIPLVMVWSDFYQKDVAKVLKIVDIEVIGGEFRGNQNNNLDVHVHNSTLRDVHSRDLRWQMKGGNNRILNSEFDGHVRPTGTATILFQSLWLYDDSIGAGLTTAEERNAASGDADGGTFEIDGCVFRNGYFGILQQPSGGKVSKAIFRNLTFYDMMGDAIELNVVQKSFDDGCVIENIAIFNIDADKSGVNTPSFQSNWGIGVGLAGKSPYGYEAPDSTYVHNFAIRNVYATGVRQVVHVEVGRDFTIENIYGDPDNTVSRGSGLVTATVYIVGSKRFVVDGVYGEPKPYGATKAEDIRVVTLLWGINEIYQPDGTPFNPPRAEASNACFDYTVRNVFTMTGQVFGGCSAGPNTKNTAIWANIKCKVFKVFGIATHLDLSNIYCEDFRCVGHPKSGDGAFPDNFVRSDNTVLSMSNVNAIDANGYGGQFFSRCRYSTIHRTGGNVAVEQWVNYLGSLGTLLGATGNVFYPVEAAHGANGTRFPVGYEFTEGDVVMVTEYTQVRGPRDGTSTPRNLTYKTGPTTEADNTQMRTMPIQVPYVVTKGGVFVPDTPEAGIKAAAVGSTQLVQNLTPNATSSGSPWLFVCQFSPGTRITIPGAGAGGADLNTWVVKPPYQTPPSNTGAPITMDIAHPIQTAVPAGTRIKATNPIETRPPLVWQRSSYHGIAE